MSDFSRSDAAKVKMMVVYGFSQPLIARRLGISEAELVHLYKRELEIAVMEASAMISGHLVRAAVGGRLSAICFILKTWAGWLERAYRQVKKKTHPTIPSPDQLRLSWLEAALKASLHDLTAEAERRGLKLEFKPSESVEPTMIGSIRDRLMKEQEL